MSDGLQPKCLDSKCLDEILRKATSVQRGVVGRCRHSAEGASSIGERVRTPRELHAAALLIGSSVLRERARPRGGDGRLRSRGGGAWFLRVDMDAIRRVLDV